MFHATADQMREIDRKAIHEMGIPGVVLMENAGRSVFEEAKSMTSAASGTVVVFCGTGNNGGDGYVIARHLLNHGYDVEVHLLGDPARISGDAGVNLTILRNMGVDVKKLRDSCDVKAMAPCLKEAALVIDALLGTGLNAEVRDPYAALISRVNGAASHVLSVDIPSGLDADTGEPRGVAVRAEMTVTFQCPKTGFRNPVSKQFLGKLVVADIGIPAACLPAVG